MDLVAALEHDVNSSIRLLLRPEAITLSDTAQLRAVIKERTFRGSHYLYFVEMSCGTVLSSLVSNQKYYQVGDEVGVLLNKHQLVIVDEVERSER